MKDTALTTLDRLLDQVPVGQAPVGDLLVAGHALRRRRRRTLIGAVAAVVLVLGGGTIATRALSGGGETGNPIANSPTVGDLEVRVESGIADGIGVVTEDGPPGEMALWDAASKRVVYVSGPAYSGSCPPVAEATLTEDGLTLALRDGEYDACTADAGLITVFVDGLTQAPATLTVDAGATTRTLPISQAGTPAPRVLDALTFTLTLRSPGPDGVVRSRLTVANQGGSTVTDPGCRLSNYSFGVVPGSQSEKRLPSMSMTSCVGAQDLPPGYRETFSGPTFSIDGLPSGDYLAAIDFGEARSQRLTAAVRVP